MGAAQTMKNMEDLAYELNDLGCELRMTQAMIGFSESARSSSTRCGRSPIHSVRQLGRRLW